MRNRTFYLRSPDPEGVDFHLGGTEENEQTLVLDIDHEQLKDDLHLVMTGLKENEPIYKREMLERKLARETLRTERYE